MCLRIDDDAVTFRDALFNRGGEALEAAEGCRRRDRSHHHDEIFRPSCRDVVGIDDDIGIFRESNHVMDERIARNLCVIPVQKISAVTIIPQLFFPDDFQPEFQKAVKIGKRRHHNPIHEEGGGTPKDVFPDIREIRADFDLSAFSDAGEFVVYRIFIIKSFSLHEILLCGIGFRRNPMNLLYLRGENFNRTF